MGPRTPQPPEVIDAVFNRMAAIYGARFTRQYDPATLDTTKRIWASELAGISREGMRYALRNLPTDYPPNPLQLRMIAANRPPEALALPPPREPSPEGLARVNRALEGVQRESKKPSHDGKEWAKRLRDREKSGERLKPIVARMWRQALGGD